MNKIMVGTILTVGLCLNIGSINASDWTLGKNDTAADAEYKLVFGMQYPGITSNVAAEVTALIALLNDINDRKDISAATKSQAVKIANALKALREYLAAFNEMLKEAKLNSTAMAALEKFWAVIDSILSLITQETVNLGFAQALVYRLASFVQLMSEVVLLKSNTETSEIYTIVTHFAGDLNTTWTTLKQMDLSGHAAAIATQVQTALTAAQKFAAAATIK
ncbi:MAG: hypothetical protein LBJ96_02685 [Holosporaceae bacterium]|jgi:hypothetical protein|nr:hypothetical protein [Holosporaceae bacterium]